MSDEQADAGTACRKEVEKTDDETVEDVGETIEDVDETAGESEDEDLVERVAETEPGDLAAEIASLRERVGDLELEIEETESERDDLESRLKRKQAEFENYKKRQQKRREEEKARATENLVERLLDVRDNLRRAVDADADGDAEIREGVEATLRQLDDVLDAENVEPIEPEPGTEVDPERHEVLLRVESDRPEGTVAAVHRPGYEMAGKILRAAQVTVSE